MVSIKHKNMDNVNFNTLAIKGSGVFTIEVIFPVGSVIEADYEKIYGKDIFGGLHMLEHMSFKSPKGYDSIKLLEKLKKTGNRNATTNFDYINFFHHTVSKHKDFSIDAVLAIAFNNLMNVTDEEFENEKSVVVNEVRRYYNDKRFIHNLKTRGYIESRCVRNNLIGEVETLENITLDDLIKLKGMMLKSKVVNVNITYDPNDIDNIEEIFIDIKNKIDGYLGEAYTDTKLIDYEISYKNDKLIPGRYVLPYEGLEQSNITAHLPINEKDIIIAIAHQYLREGAGKNSFFNKFREEHGLTYGVAFGLNFYKLREKYVEFNVDVEKKNTEFAIKLFEKVIKKAAKKFSKKDYKKIIETMIIKDKMNLNLKKHTRTFHDIFTDYEDFIRYREVYEKDLNNAMEAIIEMDASYDKVKSYLKKLSKVIKDKNYVLVTN